MRLPPPIGKNNALSAVVFGVAILSGMIMIAWRWILQ
jgi:hypothetical protein